MSNPRIHGNRPIYSASTALDCVARALTEIKAANGLTWADLGAFLGKSPDQAAKYADGSATMDFITFGRAKREWNGRFSGYFDRLCVESRPIGETDRSCGSKVLAAALALSVALEDDDEIVAAEVQQNRGTLEQARDAIEAQLAKLTPRAA